MTGRHIYIDETKEQGYIVAATVHAATDVADLRAVMRHLILPGQARIHMAKEGSARRRMIADTICRSRVSAFIYEADRRYPDQLIARGACLQAVIDGLAPRQETLIVLEQDDSILQWDRKFLYTQLRSADLHNSVR